MHMWQQLVVQMPQATQVRLGTVSVEWLPLHHLIHGPDLGVWHPGLFPLLLGPYLTLPFPGPSRRSRQLAIPRPHRASQPPLPPDLAHVPPTGLGCAPLQGYSTARGPWSSEGSGKLHQSLLQPIIFSMMTGHPQAGDLLQGFYALQDYPGTGSGRHTVFITMFLCFPFRAPWPTPERSESLP